MIISKIETLIGDVQDLHTRAHILAHPIFVFRAKGITSHGLIADFSSVNEEREMSQLYILPYFFGGFPSEDPPPSLKEGDFYSWLP
ncbi:hypothetical protein ACTXT7_001547 [Hymenolepis weldensis]